MTSRIRSRAARIESSVTGGAVVGCAGMWQSIRERHAFQRPAAAALAGVDGVVGCVATGWVAAGRVVAGCVEGWVVLGCVAAGTRGRKARTLLATSWRAARGVMPAMPQ